MYSFNHPNCKDNFEDIDDILELVKKLPWEGGINSFIDSVIQYLYLSKGVDIWLDKEHYTDYMREQELLPVYPVGYDKPLFYYEVKVDDIKLTMEDRELTEFEDSTLADILTLTIPSQSYIKGSRVPNESIRGNDNYEELMEKLPVIPKNLTLELASYLSSVSPDVWDERGKAFDFMPIISSLTANYYISITKSAYDFYKEKADETGESIRGDFFTRLCMDVIKDDLNIGYGDDISKPAYDFYKRVNNVFNAETPYERYDIYKLSVASSWVTKVRLMTVLAGKVLTHAVDVNNQPLEKGSEEYKEGVHQIVNFLVETTVGDLMDSDVTFDIHSEKLKEGLPLLPLIAEFGNELNIKFSDEIPKLSDLTRETVEVNR